MVHCKIKYNLSQNYGGSVMSGEKNKSVVLREKSNEIFNLVGLEEEVISDFQNLRIDPRSKFNEAIACARKHGDEDLVNEIFSRVVKCHVDNRYTYEAIDACVEWGNRDVATPLFKELVNIKHNPDFEGARDLAVLFGEDCLNWINGVIEKNKNSELEKIGSTELLGPVYILEDESEYMVNQKGCLFKNGEPCLIQHFNMPFYYYGIANEDRLRGFFNKIMYSISNKCAEEILFDLEKKYNFTERIPFEKIPEGANNYVIIGINKDANQMIWTSLIVGKK